MKREMRKQNRKLTNNQIEKILKDNVYGTLSLITKEGYPYGVPISYVYNNGKIYFHHTNQESLLSDCAHNNSKACFTIVGDTKLIPENFTTKYESVIAFGHIKEVNQRKEVLMEIVKGLSKDYIDKGDEYANKALDHVSVFIFEVEQLTGKGTNNL